MVLIADMSIGYKFINETFSSRVTLGRAKNVILVEYVDGPFRKLENRWTFRRMARAAATCCSYIDYEFRSRTFGLLAGAVFDQVFRKMAEAFRGAGDIVYPRRAVTASSKKWTRFWKR